MKKENLLISFSGGRTSAYMTHLIINKWADKYNIVTVFANTGKEDEKTLEFVQECSVKFGIDIVWVEASRLDENGKPLSKKGWKTGHKVVTFETASRNGEPFEEAIALLGMPSTNAPWCSDQLKRLPIESYLRSIDFHDYYKAIGVRCDEVDRVDPEWRKKKIIYPLVSDFPTLKIQVLAWWSSHLFNLDIHPDLGNCDGCWKKGRKTLLRIADHSPGVFDWWQRMTDKYGYYDPRKTDLEPPFNFYRGNHSPKDIFDQLEISKKQLDLFIESEKLDGCSESCEVY